jgi:hypothetical protein
MFSETSVDFQRTTWCYIAKDGLFITTAVGTSDPEISITHWLFDDCLSTGGVS